MEPRVMLEKLVVDEAAKALTELLAIPPVKMTALQGLRIFGVCTQTLGTYEHQLEQGYEDVDTIDAAATLAVRHIVKILSKPPFAPHEKAQQKIFDVVFNMLVSFQNEWWQRQRYTINYSNN